MPDNTYQKGLDGESRAALYLQNRGMVLLQKRYRSPFGEIDLVMRDGDTLVFVEVKARANAEAGMGLAAVGPRKQARLVKTARQYLSQYACDCTARFDVIEDVRPEAAEVVRALQQAGVSVQILSGDRLGAVQRVATQAGISQAQGECTPQDKLVALQGLQAQGRHVAMVGDGLNDGPVLAGANVSFAVGRSVPLAQSRADFVVLGGSLSLVAQAVLLARQTLRVVRQNLWWAAGYNALCVPLALVGWMPAWLAGLGMALSSLLVVLNAARLSRALPGAQASGPYMSEQVKGLAPMTTASQSSLDPV